jgi:serine/threonine-protein kinase
VAAKLARFSWLPGALAAVLVIALGRGLFSSSSAPAELALYDRMMRAGSEAPADEVVIVAIDEESIARLGEWPWPRDVHASLLDQLELDEARVVAFTMPIEGSRWAGDTELQAALAVLEASNLGHSEQAQELRRLLRHPATRRDPNALLAQAMRAHGNVVLPLDVRVDELSTTPSTLTQKFLLESDSKSLAAARTAAIVHPPAPILTSSVGAFGHTYLPPDADGTVRSELAALRVGEDLLPSLSVAIVARALGIDPRDVRLSSGSQLDLNGRLRSLGPDLTLRPRYFSAQGPLSFQQYPYWQVLAGEVPSESLRDKIVLVGFVGAASPSSAVTTTPMSRVTPAVIATASGVSSLIADNGYSRPSFASAIEWGLAGLALLVVAFALPAAGPLIGAVVTVLSILFLAVTEFALLSTARIWLHLMLPSGAILAGYLLYLVGDLIRRANARSEGGRDQAGQLRSLGQTFQRQGQLDLAFETYRRCPLDASTMELLYNLGLDFERRRQNQKAANVYAYIATRDPNYRDLRARRARVKEEPLTRSPKTRPPATPPAGLDREPDPADIPFSPATGRPTRTLGRYEIERELGKGAMGTVYLGRDPNINRVVAIKAIPLAEEFEEEDLAEARARFFREAEMAGRLNHPAIVTVHDAGEDQGLAYIAMEYLRGQHLSHYTDPSRLLPWPTVLELMARVADALDYAHRQNVVHRDIKPANIMFNPDTDELKITDFGIARLTDTSRTKTGIVLGTPSFMSPEQLEGRPLDGRSDQFALGVSLYQLLCGQLPFRADTMPRLMHKIATEPHAPIRSIRPELPEGLDAIFDRVLAKSADKRYPNCGELAQALRACARSAQPSRASEPAHEWLLP